MRGADAPRPRRRIVEAREISRRAERLEMCAFVHREAHMACKVPIHVATRLAETGHANALGHVLVGVPAIEVAFGAGLEVVPNGEECPCVERHGMSAFR